MTIPRRVDVRLAYEFLESRVEWIIQARERLEHRREQLRTSSRSAINNDTTQEQIEQMRRAALQYLPGRIAQIAAMTGLSYSGLRLGCATTRWGSCNQLNAITLTIFIMALPSHLIDFIITHELCHTVHHNHSPKFHALVNELTHGHERELDRELKTWRIKI